MASPRIKGKACLWGVGNIYASEVVTNIRRKDGGETDFVRDHNGFKISKIYFDDEVELEIDIIMTSTTSVPIRGDTITVTGAGGAIVGLLLCDATEIMWDQKGWTKLKITATAHVNLTS